MDPCYPERKKLSHNTPEWVEAPEYFITLCCRERAANSLCQQKVAQVILDSVKYLQSRGFWVCELLVLMPDHLHLLAALPGNKSMAEVITLWKRWIAAKAKIRFQRGFFDHRLRSVGSACQKWNYIHMNPVRAGLSEEPIKWPYRWTKKDFESRQSPP